MFIQRNFDLHDAIECEQQPTEILFDIKQNVYFCETVMLHLKFKVYISLKKRTIETMVFMV